MSVKKEEHFLEELFQVTVQTNSMFTKENKNNLDFKFKSLCASKNTLECEKATYRRKRNTCKSHVLGSGSSLYKERTL